MDAWTEPFRAGRLEEALDRALEARERFPERADWTWYPVAAAQLRLGRPEAAAATIRGALATGVLWRVSLFNSMEADMGLDLGHPEVAAAVAAARGRVARLDLRPILLVEPALQPGIRPLLLIFHGATGNARLELDAWRPAIELGYSLAGAQSSQPSTATGFCWDPPDDRIAQDLDAIRKQLPSHGRLVLAGFSQGGWLALKLALAGALFPAAGVVLVAPFVGALERLPPAARRLRVAVLAGADDAQTERLSELVRNLAGHGHHVEMHLVAGHGHAYPTDFATRIPFLLEAASRGVSLRRPPARWRSRPTP